VIAISDDNGKNITAAGINTTPVLLLLAFSYLNRRGLIILFVILGEQAEE